MGYNSDEISVIPGQSLTVKVKAASASMERGQFVCLDSDGEAVLTDADATATSRALGVIVDISGRGGMNKDETAIGDSVEVCFMGIVDGFTSLVEGPQYLGLTAGEITHTAPTAGGDSVSVAALAVSQTRIIVGIAAGDIATH
ncbi:MAG: hypothetical protein OXG15_10200 [Gammaproteobacteria bacterium]|nr:hypothetical protein [Gammaproteobacteria bacterium]